MTTVHEAWSAVMGDVQSISKSERNDQQRFNFRGIDAVMQAVGPALRRHGVSVVPVEASVVESERYQTARGGLMQGVVVSVSYEVHGPDGDTLTGGALGAAADAGDKAVPKAMSVAYRTFLLQALTVPTDEPDPDYEVHERVVSAPDPLLTAKNNLLSAVTAAGMEMEAFIDWAKADRDLDLRSASAVQINDLAALVQAQGRALCEAPS